MAEDGPPVDLATLRFRVTDLRRRPGSRASERRVVQPGELTIGEVRVSSQPVTVDVHMESMNDGVRVDATVDFDWEGACRRCLGTARGSATGEILELFVDDPESYADALVPGSHAGPGDPIDPSSVGEVRELADGWVDLSQSVRDALLLGLPLAPLCSAECPGPSPEEFPVGAATDESGDPDDTRTDEESATDPRWAALEELHFDSGDG